MFQVEVKMLNKKEGRFLPKNSLGKLTVAYVFGSILGSIQVYPQWV
jgi:hypothetical protein